MVMDARYLFVGIVTGAPYTLRLTPRSIFSHQRNGAGVMDYREEVY